MVLDGYPVVLRLSSSRIPDKCLQVSSRDARRRKTRAPSTKASTHPLTRSGTLGRHGCPKSTPTDSKPLSTSYVPIEHQAPKNRSRCHGSGQAANCSLLTLVSALRRKSAPVAATTARYRTLLAVWKTSPPRRVQSSRVSSIRARRTRLRACRGSPRTTRHWRAV